MTANPISSVNTSASVGEDSEDDESLSSGPVNKMPKRQFQQKWSLGYFLMKVQV